MKKEESKRDIEKRSYKFGLDVIKFIDSIKSSNYSTQVIIKQLLRSCTSIGANIAESQAASSKKDFINFLHHALKSANESKFWFCLLRDSGKANNKLVEQLLAENIELSNILASIIIKSRNSSSS